MRVSLVMVADGKGGVQQSVVFYAAALSGGPHEVDVVIPASSPLVAEVEATGAPVRRLKWRRNVLFGLPQLRELKRVLAEFKPDVVIGFGSKGFAEARRASPRGVPVLTRCGTMKESEIKRLVPADAIIVTSDEMQDLARKLGARTTFILPNFLRGTPSPPRQRGAGPVRIGSLGRFVRAKGFDLLIRAVAELRSRGRDVALAIGGDGRRFGKLQALADSLGLDVAFPGWLGSDDKPAFLGTLDIFVGPSRDEPFGIVFLEAMQAGLPVVAADTVGARTIFTHGEDGLVFPHEDVAGLARQLELLIDDGDLRQRIAAAGAATFLKRFHIDGARARLNEILEEALVRGPQEVGQR